MQALLPFLIGRLPLSTLPCRVLPLNQIIQGTIKAVGAMAMAQPGATSMAAFAAGVEAVPPRQSRTVLRKSHADFSPRCSHALAARTAADFSAAVWLRPPAPPLLTVHSAGDPPPPPANGSAEADAAAAAAVEDGSATPLPYASASESALGSMRLPRILVHQVPGLLASSSGAAA